MLVSLESDGTRTISIKNVPTSVIDSFDQFSKASFDGNDSAALQGLLELGMTSLNFDELIQIVEQHEARINKLESGDSIQSDSSTKEIRMVDGTVKTINAPR